MKAKTVKISELTPDDINANRGTPRGSAMLEKSLREYGAGRSVLVDKAGRIIAGNKTIEAAGSIGLEDAVMVETDGTRVVIVKRTDLDLDSPQGRGLAIADNRVAEVGLDWDLEALEKIGEELDLGEFWFDDELPEIDFGSIDGDEDEPTGDADAVPEVEDVPTSRRGDLWILGDHRVLCGDSTNADDVARLMNGERADMVFTDPPYGVSLGFESPEQAKARNRRVDGLIVENDDLSGDDLQLFLSLALTVAAGCTKPGGAFYVCSPIGQEVKKFIQAMEDSNLHYQSGLVWNKSSLVLSRHDYHPKHEIIHYGWKKGAAHRWFADRKQTTVIDFDKPSRSEDHPTTKPIDLVMYFVGNVSISGDLVLDSFLGSGSTLIAAEETGRKCYGMEISPQYVDVIVKRWQDYTGKEATHEDGRTFAQVAEERASNEAQETEEQTD